MLDERLPKRVLFGHTDGFGMKGGNQNQEAMGGLFV